MKHIATIATVFIGLMVSTGLADEVYLKDDATGKVLGPFQTDAGAKFVIGTNTFTVVKQTSAVETKLASMNIADVSFRSASVEDVVDTLSKLTGVNFVVMKDPPPKRAAPNDPFDDPFFGPFVRDFDRGPEVTLSLKNVSALKFLQLVMQQTGYSYKISENLVTIYPQKQAD